MKKFFVFVSVALLAIFITTSCNNQLQPSRKITVKMDTTIYKDVPVTKPLYSCNTGERRPYDKLLGMNSVPVKISLQKDTIISGNDLPVLAKNGRTSSNDASLAWLLPILAWLLGILAIIAFLMLAFWVLREFWRRLFGPRSSGQAPDNHEENAEPNQQRVVTPGSPNQPIPSQTRDEVSNHQLSMAESLVAKQQIHKIVQTTKSRTEGNWSSWKSEIEIITKNEERRG